MTRNATMWRLLLGGILLWGGFVSVDASATTIDPYTWEQLVDQADFVGVVECSTAGGIVAKYRVLETWKGEPAPNEIVSIRQGVNYWGPQFPIDLVGERFFVAASKAPRTRLMSTTMGGGVPEWWREIPSDFALPLLQGKRRLPDDPEQWDSPGSRRLASWQKWKQDAKRLIHGSPKEREGILLKSLIRKYWWRLMRGYEGDTRKQFEQGRALLERMEKTDSTENLLKILREIPASVSEDDRRQAYLAAILGQGGGPVVQEKLRQQSIGLSLDEETRNDVLRQIERRLSPKQPPSTRPKVLSAEEAKRAPSAQQLDRYRKILQGNGDEWDFGTAFVSLSEHEPEAVVRYLLDWSPEQEEERMRNAGQVLGSLFGWRCGENRQQHFRKVLEAEDPWIQAAAAIYLTMEDRPAGMKALRRMTQLEGGPGAWAAVNLARRGHKSAVPRALKLLARPEDQTVRDAACTRLKKRLRVLLSNTAKASDLPQPWKGLEPVSGRDDDAHKARAKQEYEHYLSWWRQYRSQAKLTDPWLPTLKEQKVD